MISGRVRLWNDAEPGAADADEVRGPGGVFGFSAMLTERSVGPRAVAEGEVVVARIPASLAAPAFASRTGARFLAEIMTTPRRPPGMPTYSVVDELIVRRPLLAEATTPAGEVARRMTEQDVAAAVVRVAPGVSARTTAGEVPATPGFRWCSANQ